MVRRFFSRGAVLAVVSLLVLGAAIFKVSNIAYALRPQSTVGNEERLDDAAKNFGYGFAGAQGATLAHDKVFRVKAAIAFEQGRAVSLFGHQAADLEKAVDEYLQKSGEVGISRDELIVRLRSARAFLEQVFSDQLINRILTEIAKIDANTVKDDSFLTVMQLIAQMPSVDVRLEAARQAIVSHTRFVAFLFGEKGIDPFLFSVGNILSKEHRALVAHIGTFPYGGGESMAGGPRTIYASLARIEGFAKRGDNGLKAYQEMMLHEFTDLAYGRHVDPSRKVLNVLNTINTAIDKEYQAITQTESQVQEEGSVIVSNPRVTIEKYRLETDLGKKDTFAIKGSSKVHPNIPKGQEVTITIAKADVGSIGGHGTAPGHMLEAVAEVWMKAAEEGYILDFFITRVGDDISVTITHNKGKDDRHIHELIWNGFVNGAVIAKDLGYYGAGQDLLADAFSGNVRGAGPSVAEMVIKEQAAEVLIFGQADKTAPGAFNRGLYEIFFGNDTTWRMLGPGEAQRIRAGILDFDYNGHVGRHVELGQEDYDAIAWYAGVPDRYTFDYVVSGSNEDVAAVTAQRLGIIAGEYVGKDDPMFVVRSQKRWPAVGEITSPFLKGDYLVPGWMRGSNKGPFLPVALKDARIGIYDGPPLLGMWSFNLTEGRLVGFYDLMGANPAIRHIQDRRTSAALRLLEEGFAPAGEMGLRLPETEIEYQSGPERLEKRLADKWKNYEKEKGAEGAVEAQKAADTAHEGVARAVAAQNQARIVSTLLRHTWGSSLAAIAEPYQSDIHHQVSEAVFSANTSADGRAYPILINAESLLTASPDGIMAFQSLVEQLGKGNIKFVLHINRDGVLPGEVDLDVDETLAKINAINGGYTRITWDMFAAVVVGTNPEAVSQQVQDKVGAGVFQVIGPSVYAKQYKGVIQVVLDQASKGQMALMAKALKLGVELIPVNGKMSQDDLNKLDALFSQDADGSFHVAAGNVVETLQATIEDYQRQIEAAGVRV